MLPWQDANNPKKQRDQNLVALTYTLLYAACQTHLNPDEMVIEQKLFALAI